MPQHFNTIMYIATRDIAPIVLFLKKYKSMIYYSGCSAIVYTKNKEFMTIVKRVALANGLFVFEG